MKKGGGVGDVLDVDVPCERELVVVFDDVVHGLTLLASSVNGDVG